MERREEKKKWTLIFIRLYASSLHAIQVNLTFYYVSFYYFSLKNAIDFLSK